MQVRDLPSCPAYYPSILVYGPLGTGKTGFAATAGEDCFIYDFDRGIKTASTLDDRFRAKRHECQFESFFEDDQTLPKQYLRAQQHIIALYNSMKKGTALPPGLTRRPKIACLDTFTGLIAALKYYILSTTGKAHLTPSEAEWGMIVSEAENFMSLFKSLPCVKLVNAHEMPVTDASGDTRWKLLCPGKKLPGHVAGLFDDVLYSKILMRGGGGRSFVITATATSAIEARTRSNFRSDFNLDDGLPALLTKLGYSLDENPAPTPTQTNEKS